MTTHSFFFKDEPAAINFFHYLNARHPNISFTMESESNNSLAFLDVFIRRVHNTFETSVYRKPTFSGLYQKWSSFAPKSHKLALINTLFYRAWMICSSLSLFHTEASNIRTLLRKNGYPTRIINKNLQSFMDKRRFQTFDIANSVVEGPAKKLVFLKLPFLGTSSVRLRRQLLRLAKSVLPWVDLRIIFNPSQRLRRLSKLKDPLPLLSKSMVVYKVKCSNCDSFYIGKTIRCLSTRMEEHTNTTNSAIYQHSITTSHIMNTFSPEILASDRSDHRLLIKESLLIREHRADRSLNGNIGTAELKLW